MRISRNFSFFAFSGDNKPATRVSTPCHLTFETLDALNGQVVSEEQRLDSLDFDAVNPATGPVYIEGAKPGDALCVRIRAIRLESVGVTMTIPGAGLLPDQVNGKVNMCRLTDKTFFFKDVELPLNPMIGVIGVAPAEGGISCGVPGAHGGNMDTTGIGQGSMLYLPVFVPGALFGLGDLHAAMGDGEVCVTGIETVGEVDLSLDLEKNMRLPCPLLKTRDELAFLASAESTDQALQLSVRYMNDLLVRETDLDLDDALMLMSLCGNARISQVVDPLKTARFCMPLEVLKKFGLRLAF